MELDYPKTNGATKVANSLDLAHEYLVQLSIRFLHVENKDTSIIAVKYLDYCMCGQDDYDHWFPFIRYIKELGIDAEVRHRMFVALALSERICNKAHKYKITNFSESFPRFTDALDEIVRYQNITIEDIASIKSYSYYADNIKDDVLKMFQQSPKFVIGMIKRNFTQTSMLTYTIEESLERTYWQIRIIKNNLRRFLKDLPKGFSKLVTDYILENQRIVNLTISLLKKLREAYKNDSQDLQQIKDQVNEHFNEIENKQMWYDLRDDAKWDQLLE